MTDTKLLSEIVSKLEQAEDVLATLEAHAKQNTNGISILLRLEGKEIDSSTIDISFIHKSVLLDHLMKMIYDRVKELKEEVQKVLDAPVAYKVEEVPRSKPYFSEDRLRENKF